MTTFRLVVLVLAAGSSVWVVASVVAVVSLAREAAARREAERVARVREQMRQMLLDGIDYTPVSREAEAWLKGVTRP